MDTMEYTSLDPKQRVVAAYKDITFTDSHSMFTKVRSCRWLAQQFRFAVSHYLWILSYLHISTSMDAVGQRFTIQ
jgi:hypothetical protein